MPNKDVKQLLRECERQGAIILDRKGGRKEVHGPRGFYIVHVGLSAGGTTAITRKYLREIGFNL